MQGLCYSINPSSVYWLSIWAKMLVRISLPPARSGRQRSINDFWSCILDNQRAVQQHSPITNVLATFIGKKVSKDCVTLTWNSMSTEHQRSIYHIWSCIMDNPRAVQWHWPIITELAAIMCKDASDDIATTAWKWESTDQERFLVLHHGYSMGWATGFTHTQNFGRLYGQNWLWQYRYRLLKMSVNGASTVFVGAQ